MNYDLRITLWGKPVFYGVTIRDQSFIRPRIFLMDFDSKKTFAFNINTIIEYTVLNMTILIISTDTTWKNVILVQCDTIETIHSIFPICKIVSFCNS